MNSRTNRKKLTPKQRVLKKYPKATAYQRDYWGGAYWWQIWDNETKRDFLGMARASAASAWADAARRLK